jgi:hypothetical protein
VFSKERESMLQSWNLFMNTNLMKSDNFQTANQTAIALDQHAMIRVSLVVMALFSISMARATSSSA